MTYLYNFPPWVIPMFNILKATIFIFSVLSLYNFAIGIIAYVKKDLIWKSKAKKVGLLAFITVFLFLSGGLASYLIFGPWGQIDPFFEIFFFQ
jgi:hypothetical protein